MNNLKEISDLPNNDAVVTICSLNYIHKAIVLLNSYHQFNPEDSCYLLIVDKKRESLFSENDFFHIIWVEELFNEEFYSYAFTFDVLEFNTNVKPRVLKSLLSKHDKAIYLDPDIQVFAPLDIVKNELKESSIVITPHYTNPIIDNHKPTDLDLLKFGAYNLGFVAVSKTNEAFEFLDWWGERCLEYGFYEPQSGLGVDQKWIDLAPSFFPNLTILRHPGLNVAFWNLHERTMSKELSTYYVNVEYPLIFFHFSSFSENNPEIIASKQSRFEVGSREDLKMLFNNYATLVKTSKFYKFKNEKYSFDYFEDGLYITPMLRRVYSIIKDLELKKENPFLKNSSFRKYAKNLGLVKQKNSPIKRYTFKNLNQFKKQEIFIFWILRIFLRIIGPGRYFNFMRYLGYISSIRNQYKIFYK
jgi:hypothetical protein